jgi:hypothetical protein
MVAAIPEVLRVLWQLGDHLLREIMPTSNRGMSKQFSQIDTKAAERGNQHELRTLHCPVLVINSMIPPADIL